MDRKFFISSRAVPFSGTAGQNWDQWITRLEIQTAGLKDGERVDCLLSLLEGGALDALSSLDLSKKNTYDDITSTLAARFGANVSRLQAHAELTQCRQEPGEALDDFASRLRNLGRLAYPPAPAAVPSQVAAPPVYDGAAEAALTGYFLAGLRDGWLQTKLCEKSPDSLHEALKLSKTLLGRKATIEAVRRTTDSGATALPAIGIPPAVKAPADRVGVLEQQLERVQRDLQRLLTSAPPANPGGTAGYGNLRQRRPPGGPTPAQPRGSGGRRCYGCNEEGHMVRNCPRQGSVPPMGAAQHFPPPFCLGCGTAGHWLVECPRSGTTTGRAAWSDTAMAGTNQSTGSMSGN